MTLFEDKILGENKFAKSNPNYLNSMFGRTDLKPFWLADMDFKVASPIVEEIKRLAERGNFSYEFNSAEVFSAISNWNKRRNGLELNPKSFLQVPGVLTGIALLIRELTNEGDGVLVQSPVYHQFFQLIKSANRTVVDNPLKIVDGNYQMDFEDLALKLTSENVKAIILCNPHNPLGKVWSKTELEQLVSLANENNVTIISDEIHSDIIYAPNKFNSIASIEGGDKHIAVLGSPAKAFGMHSISNGYVYIANSDLRDSVKKVISSMYLDHGNVISSYATLAAYNKSEDWIDSLITYLKKNIDWVENFLSEHLPEVTMYKPEGTYQIWLDFSGLKLSPPDLNRLIVDGAKLALTPGAWFGGEHQQFMRINIASPLSEIQQAFESLKHSVEIGADACQTSNVGSSPCCG